jgi:hypothetical protein
MKITLEINNFDNDAMAENPQLEVSRILRKMADRVENEGVENAFENRRLMDINGNQVGFCEVTDTN